VRIDPAAWPFVALAGVPSAIAASWTTPAMALALLSLPVAIALFFRDPDRVVPAGPHLVVAPADGRVTHAGAAREGEAPPGDWRQVTIFLSLFDVHINRSPVGGVVTRIEYVPGSFVPAYRHDAHRNEHSEIWVDAGGAAVVIRQVVGVLARRIVCRLAVGQTVARGARIGLMKFGSRMDVFVPVTAAIEVSGGARVRAGETIIARLGEGGP
jgi:phosphatidylserine decarboxylase